MEFFCVRSKHYYYIKKKVKSEYKSRPCSSSTNRGKNQQGKQYINQIITMANPRNFTGNSYSAWVDVDAPDHLRRLASVQHSGSPSSSRKPSDAYSSHLQTPEDQNWHSDEVPHSRSPSIDVPGTAEDPHSRRRAKKPAGKKEGAKLHHRSSGTTATVYTPESVTAEQIYVYPWSVPHISFPIVDHTKERRAHHSSSWPACYMALAPNCATCHDIEAVLAPAASNLVVIARTTPRSEGRRLSSFKDLMELREECFQLEIWDEEKEASGPKK
ncbi:hypothetical protein F4810DRAFT_647432 [Camillea tinctor]|nr:hypothetical protein F4810DRAFT_647432 [Camillea tinctor]